MTVTVRYAVLPSRWIINLASPRYLPEIALDWAGAYPWHSERYEPVRDLMESMYVAGFNAASGHYHRLEASVLAEGFRNPIMCVAGGVQRRDPNEIPPDRWAHDMIVCEYLGGSRLWVAQKHDMDVPCIVNDLNGTLPNAEVLPGLSDVFDRFGDAPTTGLKDDKGVYLNHLPYVHLPAEDRYGVREQSEIRAGIIGEIKKAVAEWLEAHDG